MVYASTSLHDLRPLVLVATALFGLDSNHSDEVRELEQIDGARAGGGGDGRVDFAGDSLLANGGRKNCATDWARWSPRAFSIAEQYQRVAPGAEQHHAELRHGS